MSNNDLPKHAFNKVKRALDDVLQLADTPDERLRICLVACAATVGAAGGTVAGIAKAEGIVVNEAFAIGRVLELIRVLTGEGADNAWAKLNEGVHTNG